jgi:hypothetical protein
MIVKYLKDGVWGYIDNVRQVGNKDIDCNELITRYNEMPQSQSCCDTVCYMNSEKLPVDIAASNKVFTMATIDLPDEGINRHMENFIDGTMALENYPAAVIMLYIEDCKEYDAIVLVTNQKCFLMNDKGQTIERLV